MNIIQVALSHQVILTIELLSWKLMLSCNSFNINLNAKLHNYSYL